MSQAQFEVPGIRVSHAPYEGWKLSAGLCTCNNIIMAATELSALPFFYCNISLSALRVPRSRFSVPCLEFDVLNYGIQFVTTN